VKQGIDFTSVVGPLLHALCSSCFGYKNKTNLALILSHFQRLTEAINNDKKLLTTKMRELSLDMVLARSTLKIDQRTFYFAVISIFKTEYHD